MNARRRTGALLEVLGVYLGGQLVRGQRIRRPGVSTVSPLESFTAGITNTELIAATRQMFVLLMLQYAGYFVLIIPINWWYRPRGLWPDQGGSILDNAAPGWSRDCRDCRPDCVAGHHPADGRQCL